MEAQDDGSGTTETKKRDGGRVKLGLEVEVEWVKVMLVVYTCVTGATAHTTRGGVIVQLAPP